ncbi:SdrD B-like domain-containing protein, partial [Paracoccus sp. (in: a-proteobacteria)]|uniref:SdrD B-like domain-containing protein n=1 Tax=Paracoccus sp. TaxID=267 RepID=UPI003A845250
MSGTTVERFFNYSWTDHGEISGGLTVDVDGTNDWWNYATSTRDPGVVGSLVQLLDVYGNVVAETQTSSTGRYSFNAKPGDYFVKFVPINGYDFVPMDIGSSADADSDARQSGVTDIIHLRAGNAYLNIDASINPGGDTVAMVNGAVAAMQTSLQQPSPATYSYGFATAPLSAEYDDNASRVLGNELIYNGNFENHDNAGAIGFWNYYSFKGWSAAGPSRFIELQTGNYNTGNKVGNAIVELDATAGKAEGITARFTAAEAGVYQVSFDYGVRAYDYAYEPWWHDSASNGMLVSIDGKQVQHVGPGVDANFKMGFQHRTFDVYVEAGTHTVTFMEHGYDMASSDDGLGALLDNVSVRKVNLVHTTGNINGTLYYDGNLDGQQNDGEQGLAGKTVYLLNNNMYFVYGPDGAPVSAVTDVNGNYTFSGINPNVYRVAFPDAQGTGRDPNNNPVQVGTSFHVEAGKVTMGVDYAGHGSKTSTSIKICENETFVKEFQTDCKLISEDVYFMVDEPVCARLGRVSFDENPTTGWNNSTTTAVPYYVFLDKPATTDLTFTVKLTVDPDKVAVGANGYAPDGFAYLTDRANEVNAPRYEEYEVTVKAGQSKSGPVYVGTEAAALNYTFGIEIENIYNHDLDEDCARVQRVVTTPVAIDLNMDGKIGVTGATTSSNKTGLKIGDTVHFDMNADGKAERMEWFDGSGDGILVDNRDGNAFVSMNGARLFGTDNGKYSDGYAKLRAQFDSNGDGVVKGAELNGLALWVDDGDAVVESGELQSLSANSITEISGRVSTQTDALGRQIIRSTVQRDFEATGNVTYRLTGPDAALFTVDAQGNVKFKAAPDFENPLDSGKNNIYEVTLIRDTDDPTCKPQSENLRIEICDKPSLGDTVWYDTNKNGVLDGGETGAAGVTVKLLDANTNAVVATQVTDANGKYLFDDLNAGNYKVMFVAPSGYEFTVASPAGPEAANNDSDARAGGMTGTIILSEGEHQLNIDAGLIQKDTGTASLGDYVWYDKNADGIQNHTTETGAAGVTVQLINPATGAVLATTTTDASGKYLFNNLNSGDYQVKFISPNGYEFTRASTFNADEVPYDSDANQTTGLTGTINLSIGEAERDVDAGLVQKDTGTASLGDTVWYDANKNGTLDAGEGRAQGVTVQLINPTTGAVIATQVTDANGNYLFSNLNAGNYQVKFVAPNGYEFTTQSTVAPDAVNNDSDAGTGGLTGTINLSIGEAERDVDAGLVQKDTGTASLGDTVWYDANKNGTLDAGEGRAQ